jgi:hypothetical protein
VAWEQLTDIAREAAAYARADATPVACPHDGEPLRTGPEGVKYCPYDGWRAT